MDRYYVEVTFTHPLLGATPRNKDEYGDWIAKDVDDERKKRELDAVEPAEDPHLNGFLRLEDGSYALAHHVIKGFFKETCGGLRRNSETHSSKLTAYKKVIDLLVFAEPDLIRLDTSCADKYYTRPVRKDGPMGPETALVTSEEVPPGTKMEFFVDVLGQINEKLLREWLDYGSRHGFGQRRNDGWGRFTYELIAEKDADVTVAAKQ